MQQMYSSAEKKMNLVVSEGAQQQILSDDRASLIELTDRHVQRKNQFVRTIPDKKKPGCVMISGLNNLVIVQIGVPASENEVSKANAFDAQEFLDGGIHAILSEARKHNGVISMLWDMTNG